MSSPFLSSSVFECKCTFWWHRWRSLPGTGISKWLLVCMKILIKIPGIHEFLGSLHEFKEKDIAHLLGMCMCQKTNSY